MTKYALGAAFLAAGFLAAIDPPLSWADDPPPTTTVVVTQTVTVDATYQGWDVRTWARHAVGNRREANQQHANSEARGRTIARLRHAARAQAASGLTGLVGAFLCIHGHEGPWDANTGNGYENGLQMDHAFQTHYGAWALRRYGPSYRWPPDVQVVVALTAYFDGRGFFPWPNTARMCGLL